MREAAAGGLVHTHTQTHTYVCTCAVGGLILQRAFKNYPNAPVAQAPAITQQQHAARDDAAHPCCMHGAWRGRTRRPGHARKHVCAPTPRPSRTPTESQKKDLRTAPGAPRHAPAQAQQHETGAARTHLCGMLRTRWPRPRALTPPRGPRPRPSCLPRSAPAPRWRRTACTPGAPRRCGPCCAQTRTHARTHALVLILIHLIIFFLP